MLSPELDLLDQLLGGDEPLSIAWYVFKLDSHPEHVQRAQHALWLQVQTREIELVRKDSEGEQLVKQWEVRPILADLANWIQSTSEIQYYLRLTEKGADRVA